MKKLIFILAALGLVALVPSSNHLSQTTFNQVVSGSGGINLPADFRAQYAHLGSWFVPEGDASGFHDVYTQTEAIAAFRENGSFPDGAVLIKELRAHDSKAMTTGQPSWANDTLKQWFVMVKDTEGRFAGNPNWGDGWGWALFQPGKQGNVSTDYKVDCLGCHVPAKTK